MSEPDNFLTRWSRRKSEAEQEREQPQAADATAAKGDPAAAKPAKEPEDKPPAFDITTLPSLESISAATDMRLFLQAGVPADLMRAALRRVWTSDPTIKNFIGLAENSWDFTAPGGVPGFGPLEMTDEVRRMVAEVTSDIGKRFQAEVAQQVPDASDAEDLHKPEPPAEQAVGQASEDELDQKEVTAADTEPVVQHSKDDVAQQQNVASDQYSSLPTRRAHGRALPE